MAEQPPTTPGTEVSSSCIDDASSSPEIGPLEGAGLLSEPDYTTDWPFSHRVPGAPVIHTTISDDATASVGTAHTLQPGEKCPTCNRQVNHPKKETSPASGPGKNYKVPTDERAEHILLYEAARDHIGAKGKPFETYKVFTAALSVLLADPSMEGIAE